MCCARLGGQGGCCLGATTACKYDGEFLTPFSLLSAQTQGYKAAAVPAAAVDDHFF